MKTAQRVVVLVDLMDDCSSRERIDRLRGFCSLGGVRNFLLLNIFLLAGVVQALAQGSPPFYTDDAVTSEKGQWVFDFGFSMERSLSGDRSWDAPSVNLAYGFTEKLELSYGVPLVIVRLEGESARSGLGNSVAGVKWRFFEDDGAKLAVSVNPQIEFDNPTSSRRRGLVDNNTGFLLPFQVQKTFGAVETAFNVGHVFHARNSNEVDRWLAGVAVGRHLAKSLHVGVEIYGEATRKFERGLLIFNVGAVYSVQEWLYFSASIGRGIAGVDRPDTVGFLGVELCR